MTRDDRRRTTARPSAAWSNARRGPIAGRAPLMGLAVGAIAATTALFAAGPAAAQCRYASDAGTGAQVYVCRDDFGRWRISTPPGGQVILDELPSAVAPGSRPPSTADIAARQQAAATRRERNRQTQAALNTLGCDAGVVDGVMGRRTRSAIRCFQELEGLPRTGRLTEEDRQLLLERAVAAGRGQDPYGRDDFGRQPETPETPETPEPPLVAPPEAPQPPDGGVATQTADALGLPSVNGRLLVGADGGDAAPLLGALTLRALYPDGAEGPGRGAAPDLDAESRSLLYGALATPDERDAAIPPRFRAGDGPELAFADDVSAVEAAALERRIDLTLWPLVSARLPDLPLAFTSKATVTLLDFDPGRQGFPIDVELAAFQLPPWLEDGAAAPEPAALASAPDFLPLDAATAEALIERMATRGGAAPRSLPMIIDWELAAAAPIVPAEVDADPLAPFGLSAVTPAFVYEVTRSALYLDDALTTEVARFALQPHRVGAPEESAEAPVRPVAPTDNAANNAPMPPIEVLAAGDGGLRTADILGVTPGADALDPARGRFAERLGASEPIIVGDGAATALAFVNGEIFASDDGGEVIALMSEPETAPGSLLALGRLVYAPGAPKPHGSLTDALRAKYGAEPARLAGEDDRTDLLVWGWNGEPACLPAVAGAAPEALRRPDLLAGGRGDGLRVLAPVWPQIDFGDGLDRSGCGPVVWARLRRVGPEPDAAVAWFLTWSVSPADYAEAAGDAGGFRIDL